MYVVPYVMGPIGSPLAKVGIELTDSVYVVLNMRIMTRMGDARARACSATRTTSTAASTRCSTCNPERRFICHFPRGQHDLVDRLAATAATSCSARSASRCASAPTSAARRAGWPSTCSSWASRAPRARRPTSRRRSRRACGKTNFAMLIPPARLRGLEDLDRRRRHRWMRVGADGRLWAINPEAGYFGVAPGTNYADEPERDGVDHARHDLHERRADAGRRRLVGGQGRRSPPEELIDWQGQPVDSAARRRRPRTRTAASPRPTRTTRPSRRA